MYLYNTQKERFLMVFLDRLAKVAVKGGKFAFEKAKEATDKANKDYFECQQKYGYRIGALSDDQIMRNCMSGRIGYRVFFLEEAKRRGLIRHKND